jgi:drug/metabolite transporter (DMT)-like permease
VPRLALALAVLYVGWGAMYLAIATAVRAIPPLTATGIEYLGGGAAVLAWSLGRRRRGGPAGGEPTVTVGGDLGRARAWLGAVAVGGVMLAGGMAGFAWGEQYVSAGIAALLGATISLWMAALGAAFLGERLQRRSAVALVTGAVGVGLLVSGASRGGGALLGAVAALGSGLSWSVGALLLRRLGHLWADPVTGIGMQMLAAAFLLLAGGAAAGELQAARWGAASWGTVVAELAMAGLSAAGFLAFRWLVSATSMVLASSFSFVNPVVAVLLGAVFDHEVLSPRAIVAAVLVVVAVSLLVPFRARSWASLRLRRREEPRG